MKRRIKQNVWGNWNGYEGAKKVREFGTDESGAVEWRDRKETVREPMHRIVYRKHNFEK